MVFPDPGRSDNPELVAGLSEGIPVTDSPLLFVGLYDLIVTSSLDSGFVVIDLGRTLPARSRAFPGEFSFRIGEPKRVGVGIDDVCL